MELQLDPDRSSRIPLHRQLAEQLEFEIRRGTIKPGRELGNEERLAKRFGVSRPTMRQAILALVDKGLLVRRRGHGTQVVHSPQGRPLRLTGLFDDLTAANQHPTTSVLVREMIPASTTVAAALDIVDRQPVIHLVRLRYADGQPLAIMENFLPAELGPHLEAFDLSTTGLYQALRDAGVIPKVAQQRIGARSGTDKECQLLDEPLDSPVLTVDRTTHDDQARVLEYGTHLYRASRYEYTTTLVDRT